MGFLNNVNFANLMQIKFMFYNTLPLSGVSPQLTAAPRGGLSRSKKGINNTTYLITGYVIDN